MGVPIGIETRPHPGALTQAKDFASATYRGAKTRAARLHCGRQDDEPFRQLERASREGARGKAAPARAAPWRHGIHLGHCSTDVEVEARSTMSNNLFESDAVRVTQCW